MQLKRFLDDQFSLGKGAVKLPISSLLEGYRKRYDQLLLAHKSFKYNVWYVQPGGRTVVHFKIPSETVQNFFYDVLIELDRSGGAKSFEDCSVKFFSNCPSFVYTYAHVFYTMKDPDSKTDGMIIDKLNQKIPKDRLLIKGTEKELPQQALTDAPTTRNPANLNLPDKSIYFAIFYMIDKLDFRKIMYSRNNISTMQLLRNVQDFEILMKNRADQERKQRDQRRETHKAVRKHFKQQEKELADKSGVSVRKVKPINGGAASKVSRVKPVKSTRSVRARKK